MTPDRPDIRQPPAGAGPAAGAFRNAAAGVGVDATGWNWSAQFSDPDYDGDLDLYTVNGMVGDPIGHLPGAQLQSTG